MFADRIAFVDVETTGSSAEHGRITEVGVVSVTRDGDGWQAEEWSSLVNPGMPIPPEIQFLTGITPAMVCGAPRFEDLAPALLERLSGAVLVAHHARFDYGFLKQSFARAGIAFQAKTLCTVRLSKLLDPDRSPHSLDALIARHGLPVTDRHRALGDARVLWAYLQAMYRRRGADEVAAAIRRLLRQPSLPAHLPAGTLEAIPRAPGVYLFYGLNAHPLYIGKSTNLRARVSSHFVADWRSERGMRLASETQRIEWHETAGDLGARLLEMTLIRERLPAHNVALRRKQGQVFVALDVTGPGPPLRYPAVAACAVHALADLHGPFASRAGARQWLTGRLAEHRLCARVLGLERGGDGQPCFNRQIGRCAGCCVGEEDRATMLERLTAALAPRRIGHWPFGGPVAIVECAAADGREAWHVFDAWCLIGSAADEHGARALATAAAAPAPPPAFDADVYRLLRSTLVDLGIVSPTADDRPSPAAPDRDPSARTPPPPESDPLPPATVRAVPLTEPAAAPPIARSA
jgi:DNA polymerase-3 subunit epsilon